METTFDRLRELTQNLPPVPSLEDLVEINSTGYQVNFNHGRVYKEGEEVIALLNTPDIAVVDVHGKKGDTLTTHRHEGEKEYMLVYEGTLRVVINNLNTDLGKGDCIAVERSIPHKLIALEDVSYIAITVPASKHYPKHDTTKR